jgi:dihydrodipicolinate synthase/N-acetylneuraminate lyase
MKITGLWIPLITPLYQGSFDELSLKNLIKATQDYADGYAIGLSSGEAQKLSEEIWKNAVRCAVATTDKPIIVGIWAIDREKIVSLSEWAKSLGCAAVVVPATGENDAEIIKFFGELDQKIALPIIVYNTEKNAIHSVESLREIDHLKNIIAIKDSSGDDRFFSQVLAEKSNLKISVLQGLENKLLKSKGCDGYLISLGNIEPQLCREMFENPTPENNEKVMKKFWEYNLGGEWYITIKALLYSRGTIRSAEQVEQHLIP